MEVIRWDAHRIYLTQPGKLCCLRCVSHKWLRTSRAFSWLPEWIHSSNRPEFHRLSISLVFTLSPDSVLFFFLVCAGLTSYSFLAAKMMENLVLWSEWLLTMDYRDLSLLGERIGYIVSWFFFFLVWLSILSSNQWRILVLLGRRTALWYLDWWFFVCFCLFLICGWSWKPKAIKLCLCVYNPEEPSPLAVCGMLSYFQRVSINGITIPFKLKELVLIVW